MRNIIYDVAVSLDGFIAGINGDVSRFPQSGAHADAYTERLADYDTVIMGKNTYEFGYAFGLKPGERAYGHMEHHIYSSTIELPDQAEVRVVRDNWTKNLHGLKQGDGGDIYLCGGGAFAGFVLANGLIEFLRLKRVPLILGEGIALFGSTEHTGSIGLQKTQSYDNGVVFEEYLIGN